MDMTAQRSRIRWILAGCISLLIVGTGLYLLRTPGSSWALPFLASVLLSLATSSRRWPLVLAAAGTVIIGLSYVVFVSAALPDGSRLDHSLQSLMAISGLWTVAILGLRRKRFEYALRENEAYSRAILDTAAEGITTIDEEGKLLSFNPAAERIFGYSAAEVLGKSVALFVPPDRHREFEQVLEALSNPNAPETAGITQERMALRKDGTVFPMELSISEVGIGKRRIFTGIVRDVTERKRTEETLRESQRALSTLLANLPGMAYRCRNDESWTMLFVSEGCAELTGYRPWDLVGNRKTTYAKIIHPEDRGPVWEQVQASLQKRVPFQVTYRIITAQDLEKWVWEQGQGVFAPDGAIVALEGFVVDISDRRRAEVALRESEERFRVIADSTPVIIWVDGPDKRWTFFNKTWTDFTGKESEPGDPEAWPSSVHLDDVGRAVDAYDEAFAHWRPYSCEYRLERADGEFRLMHDRGIPRFAPDGQFAGYIGVCVDITDLRRAETLAKERESILRAILESTDDGILVVDAAGKVAHTNGRFGEMWRIPDEIVATGDDARLLAFVLDQLVSPEAFLAKVQQLYQSSEDDLDTLAFKDGRLFERFSRPLTMDGRVAGRVWNFRDVTERKRAEETIRTERDRARTYLDVAGTMLIAIDTDQRVTLVNRMGCEILGRAEDEIVGQNWFELCIPEGARDKMRNVFAQIIAGETVAVEHYENAVVTGSGQERIIEWYNTFLRDESGHITGTLSSGIDITDRKRAEEELRKLSRAVEQNPASIVITDTEGKIQYVNPKFEALTGYTQAEVLGQTPRVLKSGEQPAAVYDDLWRTIKAGSVWTGELHNKKKNGELYWERAAISPITNAADEITHFIAIKEDITERKRAKDALRDSEARTRALLNAIPDMMFLYDGRGVFLDFHVADRSTLYIPPEQFLGRSMRDVMPLEIADRAIALAAQALQTGAVQTMEYHLQLPTGELRHHEARLTACDADRTLAIVRDVTERKRTEEALHLTQFSVDHASDAIFWIRPDGRFADVNEAACRRLGYTREELLSLAVWDIDPLLPREKWEGCWDALRCHESRSIETTHCTKDGRQFPVEITANFVEFNGREYDCAFARDITERQRAEQALRESEERFRRVFEESQIGMVLVGPDFRFLQANAAFCAMTGYTEEELRELTFGDITHAGHLDQDLEQVRALWRGEIPLYRTEKRYRRKNGDIVSGSLAASLVRDGEGRPLYTVAMVEDTTERKRAEQALQDITRGVSARPGDTFFDSLVEHLARVVEADYAFVGELVEGANERIQTLAVHAKGEKAANFAYELAGTPCEKIVNQCERAFTSGVRQLFPHDHLLVELDVDAYAAIPLFASDGRSLGLLGVLYGGPMENPQRVQAMLRIMAGRASAELERKRTESALKDSESRYRQLFEDSPLGLLEEDGSVVKAFTDQLRARGEMDLRSYFDRHPEALAQCMQAVRIVTINRTALEMLGATGREELMASRRALFTDVRVSVWRDAIIAFAEGHTLFESEMRATTIGNREKTFALRAALAPGHEQTCGRILVSILDITELVRAQRELSHAKRLETAGRIAGQIAHDLNNLLGPLVAYPDLIRGELSSNNHMQPLIDDMESAALQIAEINQDLLALGRRGHYKVQSHNLNTLIETAARQLPVLPDVTIEKHLDGNLSTVRGGGAQLIRVLANLFANALEAMDGHGRLTITTGNVHLDQPLRRYGAINRGEYVHVDVADTGCGIASDIIDRIFEPFFTTKKTDKKRGSGLGLSVVHSILEDHDAYIDVDSTEDTGTTFRLYFPIVPGTADAPFPVEELPRGHGERILVVDDDPMQLRMAHAVLEQLGYHVETATSGETAVEMVASAPPELVILDMVMPGIDGAETLRRIRDRHPDQRALILSAYADTERVAAAARMGVCDVLAKPIQVRALGRAAHAALQPGLVAAQ